MSPTIDEIKAALSSLSKTELKEVKLLSEHLLGGPVQTTVQAEALSRPEALILHELDAILGSASATYKKRTNLAQTLYRQLNSLQLAKTAGTEFVLRMLDVVLLAMSECAKEDGLPFTWDTALYQCSHLDSILERQFPRYRATGILTRVITQV